MSIVTGLARWGYTSLLGLDLAMPWGVLAFALNIVAFIGSFFATILPSVLALMHFESVQTALPIAATALLLHHGGTRWIATLVTGPPRPGPLSTSEPR